MRRLCLLALLCTAALAAQSLAEKIDAILETSPIARRANWGAHAVDLGSGKVVYAYNADRYFTPASNTKLFSTALALMRLGPQYRYTTTLVADGKIDPQGVLKGDLRLVGGGDPTLSGRGLPYGRARNVNPNAPLEALVEQAWQAGLRRVQGEIIGDDTAWVWEPYAPGWGVEDLMTPDGAAVSALSVHDNTVAVDIRAGEQMGDPVRVDTRPPTSYLSIDSWVHTGLETRVQAARGETPRMLTVWGTVRRGDGVGMSIGISDPADYAAQVLHGLLERRGISVDGGAQARHRYFWSDQPIQGPLRDPPLNLATRTSAPLIEVLKIVNKISMNLYAEMVLRQVSMVSGDGGSRSAALRQLSSFLSNARVPAGEVSIYDGSGLSRMNLATPAAFTGLLRHMHASKNAALWVDTLPVGGEDGTLDNRFKGLMTGWVAAKTGTITHVGSLSGYVQNSRGEMLAFSVMVNDANTNSAAVRAFIDKVVTVLAE